jgi:hypothetical protein
LKEGMEEETLNKAEDCLVWRIKIILNDSNRPIFSHNVSHSVRQR